MCVFAFVCVRERETHIYIVLCIERGRDIDIDNYRQRDIDIGNYIQRETMRAKHRHRDKHR